MGLNRLSDEVIVYTSMKQKNRHHSSYASQILMISKTWPDSGDNSRQNDVRIVEFRQKLSEQEPFLITYLKMTPIELNISDF
jgi:hypothetical protein